MAENKKVQIKNTGGDALYPRTAAENIVNVPGGTQNVFMYLQGIGDANQFPDPDKGARYFDPAANGSGGAVYECVTSGTWTGKKEVSSWDSNTLFFWNGNVYKYMNGEDTLIPIVCAELDTSDTNGVRLDGGGGMPLKVIASSATATTFGTIKPLNTVTNGASLSTTNGEVKAIVSSATSSQLGTVKVTTTASNGAALSITSGAVKVTMVAATSTGVGAVQLATNAIASSGTNTTQAVTPAGMKNAMTWTKIQNMASSASVTVNPGESYRLIATDGAVHTLNRATSAYAGYNGADAHVQIFLDTVSVINGNDISIMDKLVPSACNNCLVKYRDGEARLFLEDVYAGFTVTVNAADVTATGTVFDGIINWGTSYITFTKLLDGEVIDMNPLRWVDGSNHTGHDTIIVGNGPDCTILSNGQKYGTYSLTVTNCKLFNQWVVQKGDLHLVSCEFEKDSQNNAMLYCGNGGRIFAENCDLTVDGRYYTGISGPAKGIYILRNCKVDRYNINSSSTIAFAGSIYNKGHNTGGDAAKATQTVLIERGAVVNISGNTNADTAIIMSAGSGIKVVSNASATSPTLGGSAIIRSHRKPGYIESWPEGNHEPWGLREDAGLNRYVSGTGTYIKGDGATDIPVVSAAIVKIQCDTDSSPCPYVFNSPISATGKVTVDDSYVVFGSSMPATAIVGHPVELLGTTGSGVTFANKALVSPFDYGGFTLASNHKILATSVTSTCQIMGATVYASAGGDPIVAQWTSGGVTSTATISAGTSKVINGALTSTYGD